MNKILPLILLIFWCLTSCSDERDLIEQGTPLEIMVEVASYSQNVDNVSSRASIHTGVVTKFAAGDDLGLIVLDKDGNTVINNYRFVVQKTGLAYRADADGNIISSDVYYNEDYTYIAYAPYNQEYNNYTSLDAIVAKHKEKLLTVYADQSTKAAYNAADLLICRTPQRTGTQLRLSFTHAMSQMKIYYNGEMADLSVEKPVPVSQMFSPDDSEAYWYITAPNDNLAVFGTAVSHQSVEGEESGIQTFSYWEAYVNLKENHSVYISIFAQPTVSYKTAGVDMGFPSGCIWAKYNLGSESFTAFKKRRGKWYDADGNVKVFTGELADTLLHASFDRGDYYGWGELKTKYGQPAVLLDAESGRISEIGDSFNAAGTKVTPLISGSDKGYYPETYIDRGYTYASIDGNIAGTEYDVVRNKLWKGEWRIPNENEVDELFRYCDVTIEDWYYEDNVRYASWIGAKDAEGKYLYLHPDNSESFGTENVRPYRYMVSIVKFTSTINGEVLYFPGGTWSDWSIDMLATHSRNHDGRISATTYNSDYGGMYYFASSASHQLIDCSSYMELETKKTVDESGRITNVTPSKKKSSYVNHEGQTIELWGLTQNGHRYTGMLIRPVYGGKNWNINPESRNTIRITVEE